MLSLRGGSLVAFCELEASVVQSGFQGAVVIEPGNRVGNGRVPVTEGAEIVASVVIIIVG